MFLATPIPFRSSVYRTARRSGRTRRRPRQALVVTNAGSWHTGANPSAPPSAAPSVARGTGRARASAKSASPSIHPIDRQRLLAAGYIDPRTADDSVLAACFARMTEPLLARAVAGAGRDRLIVVTSTGVGEGKTFAAIGLAMTLARTHAGQVLLVDCGRQSALCQALAVTPSPGLSDLLADSPVTLDEIAWRTEPGDLRVIGPGAEPTALPELIASTAALEALRVLLDPDHDRLIVVDGPALTAPLARVLAVLAGQLAVVVRAGHTEVPAVATALDRLRTHAQIGLVLNGAHVPGSAAAGDGDR